MEARAALHMAVLVVTRLNPVKEAFHMHLLAVGKTKKVALADRMRKSLTVPNAMLRKNEE